MQQPDGRLLWWPYNLILLDLGAGAKVTRVTKELLSYPEGDSDGPYRRQVDQGAPNRR